MKRPPKHAWASLTLVATAALAIALAFAAIVFTRATENAVPQPTTSRVRH